MDPSGASGAAAAGGGSNAAASSSQTNALNALPTPPRPPGLEAWMATHFPITFKQHLAAVDMHDFASSKHQLPLARIKKIMKSDEDVRMISAEAPVLFAKACELFVLDLTLRAWAYPDHGAQAEGQVPASHSSSPPPKRRTLQRNDIACAIQHAELFDFLHEIMPVLPHNPEEEGTPPHNPDTESGYGAASRRSGGSQAEVVLERPLMDPYGESPQTRRRRSPPVSPAHQQHASQGRTRKRGHDASNSAASAAAAAAAAHDPRAFVDPSYAHGDLPLPSTNRNSGGSSGGGGGSYSPNLNSSDYGLPSMSRGTSLDHANNPPPMLSTPNFNSAMALDLDTSPQMTHNLMHHQQHHQLHHHHALHPHHHHAHPHNVMHVPGPGVLPPRSISGVMGPSMGSILMNAGPTVLAGSGQGLAGVAGAGGVGGGGGVMLNGYPTPPHNLAPPTPNNGYQQWLDGVVPHSPATAAVSAPAHALPASLMLADAAAPTSFGHADDSQLKLEDAQQIKLEEAQQIKLE